MNAKVCIITTVHPSFDTRIFHKQAKTLVRAGYDVTLIAQHERDEVVDGVRVVALPRPRNRLGRIVGLTRRAFRLAVRERAHVYHLHDPELLPWGALLRLLCRANVIYDAHEDVPQQVLTKYWIPVSLRRAVAVLFNCVEKLLARACDAVLVATEGIAEKFAPLKPVVVQNYADLRMLPNFSGVPDTRQEKVLVYVGGIGKLRGAFQMIRALDHLTHIDDLRLDLVGRFDPPALENELRTLPGYQHVRFHGWVPPGQIYAHLRTANIGLACLHPEPRFTVAFPVKLFEYMAAGLPVIASNFPLWKEIVEGNECGLTVNPLDPEEIARAIEYLITHPVEAHRMGENGRRAVEKKYNWEREGQKLLKLYGELLNR